MRTSNKIMLSFLFLVLVAALYRVIPGRPPGFAPQIAMAIFAGAVIKDRKWAFIIPVLSMFISDLLYQLLYMGGISPMQGFYEGQWQNYILIALLVFVGMAVKKLQVVQIGLAALVAPTIYFLISNFLVWASNSQIRGLDRPKTFDGLLLCYTDGLPFYKMSIFSTLVFSTVLFGGYLFVRNYQAISREMRA